MKVLLDKGIREIKGPTTVKKVLKELNLIPETVLVVRNSEVLTEDLMLKDTDEIEIIRAISGG